jgi:parallel beta-helix repeat protein
MNLSEARKILGLGPDEDPRPHVAEFGKAREAIAAMVRTAPNETLADRYQKGLIEFDQALAAIQESPVMGENEVIPPPARTVVLGKAPAPPKVAAAEISLPAAPEEDVPRSRALSYFAWFTVFLTAACGGAWIYVRDEQAKENQRLIRIAFLERQGAILVENRRWQDAANAYAEMEILSDGSELAKRGRRSIEAGMAEEQTQFIGYWTGQATAELEAGRLDEAVAAARQVLDRYPAEKEAAALLGKIEIARSNQSRDAAISSAREALDLRKWEAAISTARRLLEKSPADADAKTILADATAAMEKAAADRKTAAELLARAITRDNGQFDQQALDWLREAASLAPDDAEIAKRLEKLSSYTRTLRVPGDFATPTEALASARDHDRIVLGAATWKGPLVINASVEIQGAGFAETRVECPPEEGSAITIGPDARGARVSGITFRHEAFAAGTDRFSVALVRGGGVTFVDCRFTDGSGHGLAVIDGGQASVSRSRFADNGWNGVAAIGKGSTLEVRDCESLNNFEHGMESWDGAAVILSNNRCEGNSRNGIHADNGLASATIEGNQLISNREFGLVLGSASGGKVTNNTARANLLGGIVIRAAAAGVPVTANQAGRNEGPGLVLEKGLNPATYAANATNGNKGQQVLAGADLTTEDQPAAPENDAIPRATVIEELPPIDPR